MFFLGRERDITDITDDRIWYYTFIHSFIHSFI